MMTFPRRKTLTAALVSAGLMTMYMPAQAQDFYVTASAGQGFPDNVTNNGVFTSAFTTGTVTGVNPPLTLPAGAPVNWRTNLDDGEFWTLAAGMKTAGAMRYELEYTWSKFDVSTHIGVNAGGIDLSDIDAGVLIAGNVGDLGVSVADLVATDGGDLDTSTWMLNAFYDFDNDSRFTPYIGLGLGLMNVEATYRPGDVGVISDDDNVFAYQFIGGLNFQVNESFSVFASYRYRDNQDANVNSTLLPASFDIEGSSSSSVDLGVRFWF